MVRVVLVLGGTGEARRLAGLLAGRAGLRVVSSLAGRVATPRLPAGEVWIGGFGGAAGLAERLSDQRVTAVIDATHPFAAAISRAAEQACGAAGVPLLALRRPGWTAVAGDDWHWAGSLTEAAGRLATGGLGRRVLLTTGRQRLAAFAELDRLWFLARSVEPPAPPVPAHLTVLLGRGPFTLEGERDLLRTHRIDVVVTKDSGGESTRAKLDAARELGLPVLIVRRPEPSGGPAVETVEEAAAWLDRVLGERHHHPRRRTC